ncbi:aldehyde dehydrogenase family protein, partial [Streptomyces sp. Act-28]
RVLCLTAPGAGPPRGPHAGRPMITFPGSPAGGRRIGAAAGGAVKRVALELGGKSASVVLPGADHAEAVAGSVASVMFNSGQRCNALTRVLVRADRYEEAVALAAKAVEKYPAGDRIGPLVSAAQRDRVVSYIEKGLAEGARIVAGGSRPPLERGYYVAPTVFADVTPDMTIAREEIFGPVVAFLRYEDEEDALRIANGTPYGLAGAVWGEPGAAAAFARRMEAGQVDVNGGRFNPLAPFGGYKQSGIGRELGAHGLAEYLHTKSLQF